MRSFSLLHILLLLFLAISSLTTLDSYAYYLKVYLEGPAGVVIVSNDSMYFISNSTTLPFNGSLKINIFSTNPSYILLINGTRYYNSYQEVVNHSEIINVSAIPDYVIVSFVLNGDGSVHVSLGNGTSITLNHSESLLMLNNSFVYISSTKTMKINGIETNFYILPVTSDQKINITFIQNEQQPRPTTNNFLAMGLGIIGLSFYLILKRRANQ